VRLWDVAAHRQIGAPLAGYTGTVTSVAFSPDGRTLATTGEDQAARLWDVASHDQIGDPLTGHTLREYAVAFGPDGKTLAVAMTHQFLSGMTPAACAVASRSLAHEEWARYLPSRTNGHARRLDPS
jgi:WD40 repeat protein